MAGWNEMMRADVRRLHIGGKIVFGSGMQCPLNGDVVSSLVIDEGAGGALEPGCVLSAACTLDLINDAGQWSAGGSCLGANDFTGAVIMPELGIEHDGDVLWSPLGVFQPEQLAYMEGEALLRLQARDSIGSELADPFSDGLCYPCTLQEIWNHAVGQTRYAFSGDIPNGSAIVDGPPEWNDASLRAALGCIAAAAGCFVRLNRAGSLEICRLWNADIQPHALDSGAYMKFEHDDGDYGPVDALKLRCPDDENDETRVYLAGDDGGLFAISMSENPLFRADAAHLDALAEGMLMEIAGFQGEGMRFEWRGDPQLQIGDRIALADTAGRVHSGVLTRQTLRFSAGFSASCACDLPADNNSGVRRLITPEGGLNAAALTGAVNGALLSVGSVTTNKLAAGSITAEKIAAGALDTITLEAVTAKIASLTAQDIQSDKMAAALAAFTVITAGTASFDRATVGHLVAQALNLEFGAADAVFIRNLAVEYAQMVGAAIGNLCIKASDGNYYALDVASDGSVTATKTSVSTGEIAAGETSAGRVILETQLTASQLNAGNLLATYALVNRIDAARIDVSELFAREAFIALLRTVKIVGDRSIEIIAGEIQDVQAQVDENAIYDSPTPPEKPLEAGKLWLDRSAVPAVLKRWLGADVVEDASYSGTRAGNPLVLNDVGGVLSFETITNSLEAVQGGNDTASPDNIRPISGISSAKLTLCGRNMVDMSEFYAMGTAAACDHVSANTIRVYSENDNTYIAARMPIVQLRAGVEYTLSAKVLAKNGNQARVGFRRAQNYASGNINSFISESSLRDSGSGTNLDIGEYSKTFTVSEDMLAYLCCMVTWTTVESGDATFADIQLEAADAASDFEPYSGEAVSVAFGQTVYGGELNWNTGLLTVDKVMLQIDGSNAADCWVEELADYMHGYCFRYQLANYYFAADGTRRTESISNQFMYMGMIPASLDYGKFSISNTGKTLYFMPPEGITTEALLTEYAGDHPLQFVYAIAEPFTVQLSPKQLAARRGTNVLHCDNGSITAAFTASGWEIVNDTAQIESMHAALRQQQQLQQDEIDQLRTAVVVNNDGVHVRKVADDDTQLVENEILITQRDVNVVVEGARKASFAGDFIILNGMMVRVKNGILYISPVQ